jgi:hypothetical protein
LKNVRALVGIVLLFLAASAQVTGNQTPVKVSASVDRDTITVGDPIVLRVEVSYSKEMVVEMPGSEIQLGEFEILDHQLSPPSEDPQGNLQTTSVYTLTAFSTGELEIPAIELSFRRENDNSEEKISTNPVQITVESVLTAETDDIKDIKPPLEIPRDWLLPAVALVVGAALMTAAILLWRRQKRKRDAEGSAGSPTLPPHIAAFRALNQLRKSGLLDRGEIVRYHVEVSEIIRRYFAGRFRIDALEKTSQELLGSLPNDITLSLPQKLLGQCDLVKFAKFRPGREQSEAVLEMAYEIVETTKPKFDSLASSESPDFEKKPVPVEQGGGG